MNIRIEPIEDEENHPLPGSPLYECQELTSLCIEHSKKTRKQLLSYTLEDRFFSLSKQEKEHYIHWLNKEVEQQRVEDKNHLWKEMQIGGYIGSACGLLLVALQRPEISLLYALGTVLGGALWGAFCILPMHNPIHSYRTAENFRRHFTSGDSYIPGNKDKVNNYEEMSLNMG